MQKKKRIDEIQNLPLQKHCANFKRTSHKESFREEDSRRMEHSQKRRLKLFFFQSVIELSHSLAWMCLLIRTVFHVSN